jgi:hypothetical protein
MHYGGGSRAANSDRGLILGVGGSRKTGSLFFLTAIAIAIATRPFKFHENSVSYTSSSFVSSIHSFVHKFEMASIEYLGLWRKPVCERIKKLKISCQTSFNTH